MRILFIVRKFPRISETFIINQIYDLHDKGHSVVIYAMEGKTINEVQNPLANALQNFTFDLNQEKSKLHRYRKFLKHLQYSGFSGIISFLRRPLYYYKRPFLLLNFWADVVLVHFGNNAVKFIDIFMDENHFSKQKKICTFHGFDMAPKEISLNRERYSKVFKIFDAFTYNSPYLGQIIKECNANIKTFELPVGLNLEFLNKAIKGYDNLDKRFNILFCGRIIELKGIYLLPEISKLLSKNNIIHKFTVIGDGEEFLKLKAIIQNDGLETFFELLGARNQEDVFSIMKTCSAFILPGIIDEKTGRAETQGLVIQEAQYFELPVLISDVGGMKYGMLDGVTGFVIGENNIQKFTEKLIELYKNESLRRSMGEAGKKWVIENYDIKKLNKKLINIYNSI